MFYRCCWCSLAFRKIEISANQAGNTNKGVNSIIKGYITVAMVLSSRTNLNLKVLSNSQRSLLSDYGSSYSSFKVNTHTSTSP